MPENFLIKLRPVDAYFFGGERTFNTEDDTNYFVRSNYFPQQTALLGLLRYEILRYHGLLNQPVSATKDLIGTQGFVVPQKEKEKNIADFKYIHSISPVFIRYEVEGVDAKNYIVQAKDYGYEKEEDNPKERKVVPLKIQFKGSTKAKTSRKLTHLPTIENYKAKEGLADLLIEANGGENWKYFDFDNEKKDEAHNGIFIKESRIGIQKNRKEAPEEGGFYKQEFVKLSKGYYFAFFAELETDDLGSPYLQEGLVNFGGEGSAFLLSFSKSPKEDFENLFTKQTIHRKDRTNGQALVLTSNAYAPSSIYEYCDFAISHTVNFRNIITPSQRDVDFSFSKMAYVKKTGSRYKSNKFNLLQRGSIFYGINLSDLKAELEKEAFRQIGYNYFIML